nr:hypothetical protein [Tanacetum cinerariifolium]
MPFTEITSSTQRSPVIPHRQVMILAPGQPIPHGRPYRYHPNGPVHIMIVRKRVGPLPVQQLAVRHSVDHSSPDLPSTFARPSRKRRRSHMTFVFALPPVSRALSPVRADLIPSPKRVRDSGYLVDVEAVDREESKTGTRGPFEVRVERVTHPVMPEDTPEPAQKERAVECTYETLGSLVHRKIPNIRSRESMTYEEVEELVTRRVAEETEAREAAINLGPLNENGDEQEEDTPEPAQKERAVECTYETLGSLVHRIVRVDSAVTALTERIAELERDNRRLRGTASVESQRVD